MPKIHNPKMTIQGQVVPCQWDGAGRVKDVVISKNDDHDISIEPELWEASCWK